MRSPEPPPKPPTPAPLRKRRLPPLVLPPAGRTPLFLTDAERMLLLSCTSVAGLRSPDQTVSPGGLSMSLRFKRAVDEGLDRDGPGDNTAAAAGLQRTPRLAPASFVGSRAVTFVSLLGLEGARAQAVALVDQACAHLSPYGDRADLLKQAARSTIARES